MSLNAVPSQTAIFFLGAPRPKKPVEPTKDKGRIVGKDRNFPLTDTDIERATSCIPRPR